MMLRLGVRLLPLPRLRRLAEKEREDYLKRVVLAASAQVSIGFHDLIKDEAVGSEGGRVQAPLGDQPQQSAGRSL
jgi:hypothetical protein